MLVTKFRKRTLSESLARLWPPEARRQDDRLKAEIRRLVASPDEPCIVAGVWVPDGRGRKESLQQSVIGFDLF